MKESRNNTHPNSPARPPVFPAPDTLKLIISVGVRDKGERLWRNGNSGMEYGGAGKS